MVPREHLGRYSYLDDDIPDDGPGGLPRNEEYS